MDIYNLYRENRINKLTIIRTHEIATSFVPHDSQRRQEGSADVVKEKIIILIRNPNHSVFNTLSKRTVPDAEPGHHVHLKFKGKGGKNHLLDSIIKKIISDRYAVGSSAGKRFFGSFSSLKKEQIEKKNMDIYNLYRGNGIQKFEIIRMHEIATSFVPHDSQRRQEGSADVVKEKTITCY